jgi:hypothetical protein
MRRGEQLALRWRDFGANSGKIQVQQSLEQTNGGLRIKARRQSMSADRYRYPLLLFAR